MTWEEFIAANIPAPATVTLELLEGSGAYGDVYASPVPLSPCVIEDVQRNVPVQTDAAEGKVRIAATTVYAPLNPPVPTGSRITVPGREPATVLSVARIPAHGLDLPEHQELSLE